MITIDLHAIAEIVVRRAQRQGFVVPREVREEIAQAGLPEEQWKNVVSLARASLSLRQGRYYYVTSVNVRQRQEEKQRHIIHQTIKKLMRHFRAVADRVERRRQDRFDLIQPITVLTEDGREHHLLSRDLSSSGVRLIGTRRLLGQRVHVVIPDPEGGPATRFATRILWTCAVGDDLFENGGRFLELEGPIAD
jgi:hypothetical protein